MKRKTHYSEWGELNWDEVGVRVITAIMMLVMAVGFISTALYKTKRRS